MRCSDIVVMAEKNKEWMDSQMKDALKGYKLSWQSREGSPYAAADLTRVSAGSAAMIVLLRPESDQVRMLTAYQSMSHSIGRSQQ